MGELGIKLIFLMEISNISDKFRTMSFYSVASEEFQERQELNRIKKYFRENPNVDPEKDMKMRKKFSYAYAHCLLRIVRFLTKKGFELGAGMNEGFGFHYFTRGAKFFMRNQGDMHYLKYAINISIFNSNYINTTYYFIRKGVDLWVDNGIAYHGAIEVNWRKAKKLLHRKGFQKIQKYGWETLDKTYFTNQLDKMFYYQNFR